MIRNDDVSGMGPAGGKTSWRERYRNECTIGRSKYVRNRSYANVTGGGGVPEDLDRVVKNLITF